MCAHTHNLRIRKKYAACGNCICTCIYMYDDTYIRVYMGVCVCVCLHTLYVYIYYIYIYIHMYIYICVCTRTHTHNPCTGWRRLIGSPKLQIIFHKRATKHRALLRKMSYKDKGSYESSPPCIRQHYAAGGIYICTCMDG